MILGTPKFTGIVAGEITVNRLGPTLKISVKAAFVDPATGVTYGWTTAEGGLWSKETLEKLTELSLSLEQDIANVHLTGGSPDAPPLARTAPGEGLGEHLGDAPSI